LGDRVEAALAIIAALALVYQYVNVGAIEPLPNM
jgi:hypothetical protein